MLRSGRRDREIVVQRNGGNTKDSIGFPQASWAEFWSGWAEYIPMNGAELLKSKREVGVQLAKFVTLYISGVTEKDRVVYDGQNWDILFVREIGRREGTEITAQVKR